MWTYKSTISLLLHNVDMCWILWIQWLTLSLLWQQQQICSRPKIHLILAITISYVVWLTYATELEGMSISVLQNLGLRGKLSSVPVSRFGTVEIECIRPFIYHLLQAKEMSLYIVESLVCCWRQNKVSANRQRHLTSAYKCTSQCCIDLNVSKHEPRS